MDASSNETGFKLERKTGGGGAWGQVAVSAPNPTGYGDTGLLPGTTYSYRVRATNNGSDSPYSNEASATTVQVPPQAPGNLVATAVTNRWIDLGWADGSSNEAGFEIERRVGAQGSFSQVAATATNVTGYSDADVTGAQTYTYRVRAVNSAGVSAYSSEASATTPRNPPDAPRDLQAMALSASEIRLSWTDPGTSETGFRIELKGTDGTFEFLDEVPSDTLSYSHRNLAPSTAYAYRVLAFNEGGDSPPSNEAGAQTLAPGRLVVSPRAVNFGNVRRGKSRSRRLVVRNAGSNPLLVSIGDPSPPFSLGAGAGTFRIPPGRSQSVTIHFSPAGRADYAGAVQITSDDPLSPSVIVSLVGRGR